MTEASQPKRSKRSRGPLYTQLSWFIQLRWIAAAVVVCGAWVDRHWFGLYTQHSTRILILGTAIAGYNAVLWWCLGALAGARRRRWKLLAITWAQLLLDMVCLNLLILWTGGVRSPLTPFFVLHMVFASLLLPRAMAYAAAILFIAVYLAVLQSTGMWPHERDDYLISIGRVLTFLVTVHLASHISRSLRTQRRRLLRQNQRIRAMTAALRRQQQAMIQHEKMVAMGQMAAGVTHEIANPLSSMDSLLQLLQRKPEKMRPDAVQTLREQIARINQIIQQMKTFAHPTDALQQTVDLNEIIEQSLHMVRFDARLKNVKIVRDLSPNAGSLRLLPQALQQVMVNLIINALDAMVHTPEPRLGIRTARHEGCCIVEVDDNGTGISPEHMGRLFEPFFTTKPVGKGTGLGLSISYSLIQKQGGSISVRSHVGTGTSFTIRIPLRESSSRDREASPGTVAIFEKPAS